MKEDTRKTQVHVIEETNKKGPKSKRTICKKLSSHDSTSLITNTCYHNKASDLGSTHRNAIQKSLLDNHCRKDKDSSNTSVAPGDDLPFHSTLKNNSYHTFSTPEHTISSDDPNKNPIEFDIFSAISPTPEIVDRKIWNTKMVSSLSSCSQLRGTWDDHEGYYNLTVGEIIDGRYEVFATHGRGVFSTVLRARDLQHSLELGVYSEVAIKIIRANETMARAAQLEKVILNKLSLTDPENKRHVVRLTGFFEHRNHVCLVFDSMDLNLRACVKKFGRNIGLNIHAVRAYTIQILIALKHLKNNKVLHADIKPDNILVNTTRTIVKLCDFGSAMFKGENEITPYLISRFYRAPEVILGLPYDSSMDMWSIGCVIYELFTGRILMPGKTNNQMIKLIMEMKGPFPKRMLRHGMFTDRHFDVLDPCISFQLAEEDPISKLPVKRTVSNIGTRKNFIELLSNTEGDKVKVQQLADLLEKMMMIDPEKRLSPGQALRHPFCRTDYDNLPNLTSV